MKLLILLSVSCAFVCGKPQISFPGKFCCTFHQKNGQIEKHFHDFFHSFCSGISISSSNANANSGSNGGPFGKCF